MSPLTTFVICTLNLIAYTIATAWSAFWLLITAYLLYIPLRLLAKKLL